MSPAVKFVAHDENDVLLWMTAELPAGPFDTTLKMWNACIGKLVRAGYLERIDDSPTAVHVTPEGEARAKALREDEAKAPRRGEVA